MHRTVPSSGPLSLANRTRVQQLPLFPDAFEIRSRAVAALRSLDTVAALAFAERAKAQTANLVDIDHLLAAIRWLDARLGAVPSTGRSPAALAPLLVEVSRDFLAERLTRAGMLFLDDALAHYLASVVPDAELAATEPLFVDPGERIPVGLVMRLASRSPLGSRAFLQAAVRGGHANRADLWGWLGDACVQYGNLAEAAAAYVRALVLSPEQVDFARLLHPGLVGCWTGLAGLPQDEASGLLLSEAWLRGILPVPRNNGWLSPSQLDRVLEATAVTAKASRASRCRRFSVLLYVDQSIPGRGDIVERRTEMAELLPEGIARYIKACQERERGT